MTKNKLLLILSLILILLVCSSLVYKDQQNEESLKSTRSSYNVINDSPLNSKPTLAEESNKNIIKIRNDNLDYTYINYKIKSGDDLYSLARNFMPTYVPSGVIKEIKEKNNLKNETIPVNSILSIPAEKNVINQK